ncbi:fam-m protein [Plasmodium brasilianum]|uniref:fam-m protein n=1 Tax=Plasmodium brasilianum TaxID=5824 RepID=UPI00350E5BD1|nr:fam-m protein [Plasmodium brasilianum]
MEKPKKLFIFTEIFFFIISTWILNFENDIISFNKILDVNYNLGQKLDIKKYRLLAKYKETKDSNSASLKDDIPNNRSYSQRDIYNKVEDTMKRKKSNRSSLNKAQYYTEVINHNNGIFDGKHFHFEKKWIKKKDYDYFLEKNRRIGDIGLKKIKFRNYGFGVAILFLFFVLGIGYPILQGLGYLKDAAEKIMESIKSAFDLKDSIPVPSYTYPLLFCILLFILAIIIVVGITKILINNEKYKKIKLMTE